jgi:hypothetical protein
MVLPKIVLPNLANAAKGPSTAAAEIRASLNQTAVNIEAKMPKIGGQAVSKRLPQMSSFVKGFEEKIPFKVPKMSSLLNKAVEKPLAAMTTGLTPTRGETLEVQPSISAPTRGSL